MEQHALRYVYALWFVAVLLLSSSLQAHMVCSGCQSKSWHVTDNFELQCDSCGDCYNNLDIYTSFISHTSFLGVETYDVIINHAPVLSVPTSNEASQLNAQLQFAQSNLINLFNSHGLTPQHIVPQAMLNQLICTYTNASAEWRRKLSIRMALLASGIWLFLHGTPSDLATQQLELITQFPFFFLTFQHTEDAARNHLPFALSENQSSAAEAIASETISIGNQVFSAQTNPAPFSQLTQGSQTPLENLINTINQDSGYIITTHPYLSQIAIIIHPNEMATLVTNAGIYAQNISVVQLARFLIAAQNSGSSFIPNVLIAGGTAIVGGFINYALNLYTGSFIRHLLVMVGSGIIGGTASHIYQQYTKPVKDKKDDKTSSDRDEEEDDKQD